MILIDNWSFERGVWILRCMRRASHGRVRTTSEIGKPWVSLARYASRVPQVKARKLGLHHVGMCFARVALQYGFARKQLVRFVGVQLQGFQR